ncbi:(2Fe-2S)-binding protein [Paenibacillus sp. P25]|nr:(2Fe-2S)-binding protein [Paenibacillus sp. P25]
MKTLTVNWKPFEHPFGIRPDSRGDLTFGISGKEPLTEEGLQEALRLFGEGLGSNAFKATASVFTKYYAKKLCGVLYGMSVLNEGLSLPLHGLVLEFGQAPDFSLRPVSPSLIPCPSGDRATWRKWILQSLFAENLTLLFEELARQTCVHRDILWENALVYIRHYYGVWTEEAASAEDRRRIADDYRYLTAEAEAGLFGIGSQPFAPYDTTLAPGYKPMRKTCCMRYLLPEAACCKTCPRRSAGG